MKRKIISLFLIISMLLMIMVTGCQKDSKDVINDTDSSFGASEKPSDEENAMDKDSMVTKHNVAVSEGKGYPVTITDRFGNSVTFDKKPDNIAAISGTFLGLLFNLGGQSICTTDIGGGAPVPLEAVEGIPIVGKVYNPDIEKIIELQPDLVIAQFGLQNGLVPTLNQSKIPVLAFHMRTYDDVIDHLKAIGRIIDTPDKAEEIINKMEEDKKAIVDKLPKKSKKVVILYATSQDVSVKLENSIAGNVVDILNLENIASGCAPEGMGGETTPFSMEYIVEKDPDVILVTSMLKSDEEAKRIIGEKLGTDPVWNKLRAVEEGNIVYLPQQYFLYNAGAGFVKGIEYVAKGVYPEIYGELDEQ